MPSDCLATTGSSAYFLLAAGFLLVMTGLLLKQSGRTLISGVTLLAVLALLIPFDGTTAPVSALCSPKPSSLLHGQLRVIGGSINQRELPVMTATSGALVVTALWDIPTKSGTDVVVSFTFPKIIAGDWTVEINESPFTAFEFSNSDVPFVVNSSRMLTGGPFNASTATPVHVSESGLSFEFAVTRS